MNENQLRGELARVAKKLDAQGLNRGSSGNLSVRHEGGMLITPSGMGAEGLNAEDLVFVDKADTSRRANGCSTATLTCSVPSSAR
jgi:L-fuculose-phosphate aldolase